MLIYPADRLMEIEEAKKFGIEAKVTHVDFNALMERMKKSVTFGRNWLRKEIKGSKNLDFYNEAAHFSADLTLELESGKIAGRKIFIASGSRPSVPPIRGLDAVSYLTNESVLDLKARPKSIIIIGGGYIGVEYAHFFAAIGTRVTIVQRGAALVPKEEPEISAYLERELKKRMEVHTGLLTTGIKKNKRNTVVFVRDKKSGRTKKISAEHILLATGRVSNADQLLPENTGIQLDERGYIKTDNYLLTTRKNIWAMGDAIGRQMFTHAGDKEADIAWYNATHRTKSKMDFDAVPHVVFSRPQIASVGLTEKQARKAYDVVIGRAKYSDIVAGDTMGEKDGFAKAVVEKNTGRLLGFHIAGPYATHILQEAVNVMADNGGVKSIIEKMHAFPTLAELVPEALGNLE